MALPPGLASPTLVTGKTNKPVVIDVYENNAAVQDGVVQNSIASVLQGNPSNLVNELKGVLVDSLAGDNLVKSLSELANKVANGTISSKDVKEQLKNYKNGALSSILESTGLKGFDKNFIDQVTRDAKDFGFGFVKGYTDTLAPGFIDSIGLNSFEDAEKFYKGMEKNVKALKHLNSKDYMAILSDNSELVTDIAVGVLNKSLEVVDIILKPEVTKIDVTDKIVDTSILVAATNPIIKADDPVVAKYVLDSFGNNDEGKLDFIAGVMPEAIGSSSFKTIGLFAEATTIEDTAWRTGYMNTNEFKANLKIPAPVDETDRLLKEEQIIRVLEVTGGKHRGDFNLSDFAGISDSAYEVLKYGEYGNLAGLGKNTPPLTAAEILRRGY